ncbi:hypothetical protein E2C01_082750 [Portunus trituberculatus]|uniref:Uncharacterized protein n=1 Tax=Portunus trituberculatus TaxID=210409 RepID=A0A5B7IT56_PORTR|nr:hypothetical protein [Portunus trituberculatus]
MTHTPNCHVLSPLATLSYSPHGFLLPWPYLVWQAEGRPCSQLVYRCPTLTKAPPDSPARNPPHTCAGKIVRI